MNDIKKEFGNKFYQGLYPCVPDACDANELWLWIEQKLSEAKIEILRKVYVGIYNKDEIPNIISELEKK